MVVEYVPWLILIGAVVYGLKNPDKVELWSSILARVFSKISRKAERHSVSSDIQSRLSSYIKNYSVEGVLPYGIRFKWIDKGNFESYVEDGDVVVIMDHHNNNARNFLNAVIAYTSQALFPSVRAYLPKDVLISSELLVQEKIIREERPDALEMFIKKVVSEQIKNPTVRKNKEIFDTIDQMGYFEPILLPELTHAGHRLQQLSQFEAETEVNGFVNFLMQRANRQIGDDTIPLRYDGNAFHVAIIIVAKTFVMESKGMVPYLNRVKEAISLHYDSIYLMTREGKENFFNSVIEAIKENIIINFKWKKQFKTLDGTKRKVYATVCLFRI
jgi:hypothetical protein